MEDHQPSSVLKLVKNREQVIRDRPILMSWSTLPENVREIAERELTEKQLEAFELECAGWGMMRMSRQLGITKGAAVSRIEGAHLKLRKAGVRQNANGDWYVESEVAA